MVNEYHNFNDINDGELRAWNRASVAFNILADEGLETMKDYLAQFSDEDKQAIKTVIRRVKNDGYESTRSAVSRGYQNRRDASNDFDVSQEAG